MALGDAKLAVGTWPGANRDEASVFGVALAPQGPSAGESGACRGVAVGGAMRTLSREAGARVAAVATRRRDLAGARCSPRRRRRRGVVQAMSRTARRAARRQDPVRRSRAMRRLSRPRLDATRAGDHLADAARAPRLSVHPVAVVRARRLLHQLSPAAAEHRGCRQTPAEHLQGVARRAVHATRDRVPELPHAEPRAPVARNPRSDDVPPGCSG